MPSQHFEEDPELVAQIIESKSNPLVIEPIQDAESVVAEVKEFDRAMMALRLELPDVVWRDVWRRWMELRRLIDGVDHG